MISPFSFSWFCMLVIALMLLIIAYYKSKFKSDSLKRKVTLRCCILSFALIIGYKIWAYLDPTYPFDFWTQLPLHQCNLMPIVVMIALKQNNRWLYAYSYFCGIIGVFCAVTIGASQFTDVPLLSASGIGFYGTHFLIFFCVALPVITKLYRPKWEDLLRAIIMYYIIAAFMHCLNMFMNATICSSSITKANYYYTYGADTDLTRFMQDLIPVEFLWQVCYIPVVLPAMLILILPTRFCETRTITADDPPVSEHF